MITVERPNELELNELDRRILTAERGRAFGRADVVQVPIRLARALISLVDVLDELDAARDELESAKEGMDLADRDVARLEGRLAEVRRERDEAIEKLKQKDKGAA
jgi:chromosome segregation ATPase